MLASKTKETEYVVTYKNKYICDTEYPDYSPNVADALTFLSRKEAESFIKDCLDEEEYDRVTDKLIIRNYDGSISNLTADELENAEIFCIPQSEFGVEEIVILTTVQIFTTSEYRKHKIDLVIDEKVGC